MNFQDKIVSIGKVVNTFGIKGTMKILLKDNISLNDDEQDKKQVLFYQDSEKVFQPLVIKKIKENKDNLLLIDFEDYDNISKAEKLRNREVYVSKESNLFITEPNFYEYSVVYSVNGKNNNSKIIDVMKNGQYFLFKIKVNDKEIWIPAVEEYIENVNHEQKQVFAKNIERLT